MAFFNDAVNNAKKLARSTVMKVALVTTGLTGLFSAASAQQHNGDVRDKRVVDHGTKVIDQKTTVMKAGSLDLSKLFSTTKKAAGAQKKAAGPKVVLTPEQRVAMLERRLQRTVSALDQIHADPSVVVVDNEYQQEKTIINKDHLVTQQNETVTVSDGVGGPIEQSAAGDKVTLAEAHDHSVKVTKPVLAQQGKPHLEKLSQVKATQEVKDATKQIFDQADKQFGTVDLKATLEALRKLPLEQRIPKLQALVHQQREKINFVKTHPTIISNELTKEHTQEDIDQLKETKKEVKRVVTEKDTTPETPPPVKIDIPAAEHTGWEVGAKFFNRTFHDGKKNVIAPDHPGDTPINQNALAGQRQKGMEVDVVTPNFTATGPLSHVRGVASVTGFQQHVGFGVAKDGTIVQLNTREKGDGALKTEYKATAGLQIFAAQKLGKRLEFQEAFNMVVEKNFTNPNAQVAPIEPNVNTETGELRSFTAAQQKVATTYGVGEASVKAKLRVLGGLSVFGEAKVGMTTAPSSFSNAGYKGISTTGNFGINYSFK